MQPITYKHLCAIERKAQRHFNASASAWERENNGGPALPKAEKARLMARFESQRQKGEALLTPFGIECDYPGLYPSFKVRGFTEYDVRSALSAAVRVTR